MFEKLASSKTGLSKCMEFPNKETLVLLIDWMFDHAIAFDRLSTLVGGKYSSVTKRAMQNRVFRKMIDQADTVFFWLADLPWDSTQGLVAFCDCVVALARAHGLSVTWKAMFVQLGFGLANETGRVLFCLALQSLLLSYEQNCKFSTVKGHCLTIPEIDKFSNGRAPLTFDNH